MLRGRTVIDRSQTPTRHRRPLAIAVLFLVAALGVYGLFQLRGQQFRWDLFAATFRQLDWSWLAAAILLMLLTYAGRAFRWRAMMRPICPHPHLGGLIVSTAVGFTAITLFGRAGELVRPYLVAVRERLSFSSQMAVWLLERIYDLLLVLIMFGVALTEVRADPSTLGAGLEWVLRTGGYVAGALGLICVVILFVTQKLSLPAQRRILEGLEALPARHRERVARIVTSFIGGMSSTRSLAFTAEILAYTVVEWILITAANYCFIKGFTLTQHLTLIDTVVFLGFVAFGSAVQIPGIGGGFQVAAIVVLTELFGLTLESATGFAVILWFFTYVVIVPVGLAMAFHEGLRWSKLRHIEVENNQ